MSKPVELLGRRVIQVVNPVHTRAAHACRACVFGKPTCPSKSEEEAAGLQSCTASDKDRRFAHYEEVQQ